MLEPCGLVSGQHMNTCPMGHHETKPVETVSHLARTRRLKTAQDTAGTMWPAHSLLSNNVDDSLGGFSVTLSLTSVTDVLIPRNPIFLKYFPPKFFGD